MDPHLAIAWVPRDRPRSVGPGAAERPLTIERDHEIPRSPPA